MGRHYDLIREDNNRKAAIRSEEKSRECWKTKWGWIQDEYKETKKKLLEAAIAGTAVLSSARAQDDRTARPFPSTVNQEYGWICTKDEFRLEKYGPDVIKVMPLKEYY